MKEQILIETLTWISKVTNSPEIGMRCDKALSQFHSTGKEKGLKWVRAEERLPQVEGSYVCRVNNGFVCSIFFNKQKGFFYNHSYSFQESIKEWLDESIEGGDRDKELAELKDIHDGEINLKDAAIIELSQEIADLNRRIENYENDNDFTDSDFDQ